MQLKARFLNVRSIHIISLVICVLFICLIPLLSAQENIASDEQAETSLTPIEQAALKKTELIDTVWSLEIKKSGGQDPFMTDLLRFTSNRITSDLLAQDDYPATNYSLRMVREGKFVIDTVKKNPQNDAVFIRFDLKGETLNGVLSFRPAEGEAYSYLVNGKPHVGSDEKHVEVSSEVTSLDDSLEAVQSQEQPAIIHKETPSGPVVSTPSQVKKHPTPEPLQVKQEVKQETEPLAPTKAARDELPWWKRLRK